MKKFINDPHAVAEDTVSGFLIAERDRVVRIGSANSVRRVDAPVAGKVALVSGGGSGHEPLDVGFVGYGMLDAAVVGPVFSSPTPDRIVEACEAIDSGAGIVAIVKNFSGDRLNFEIAVELLAAQGRHVETVIVDDDASRDADEHPLGRRGTAGAVVAVKIAGAAAERGLGSAAVAAVTRRALDRTRTIGVALYPGVVPHSGKPNFELSVMDAEFGVGIHGERGSQTMRLESSRQIVAECVAVLRSALGVRSGDEVLAIVNGLGGTPLGELYILFHDLVEQLSSDGIAVTRQLVGSFATSLDTGGASITLCVLDDEFTSLWDAPVDTPSLSNGGRVRLLGRSYPTGGHEEGSQ